MEAGAVAESYSSSFPASNAARLSALQASHRRELSSVASLASFTSWMNFVGVFMVVFFRVRFEAGIASM